MRMFTKFVPAVALIALAVGCQTAPKTQDEKMSLNDDANATLNHLYRTDSSLKDFVASSAGYAVFPSVGKGGLIVGGSYGRGILYEGGKAVGFSDISKVSVGAIAGAQTLTEVIVFQNSTALANFKSGNYAFTADATAVAMKEGVAAAAKYSNGVAVFADSKGGLMADASVGGQKFSYKPMSDTTSDMMAK
ncbi:MAG: hypothetical protein JWM57_3853 [Phycisphaerales bacterium]|nr:hypothetical protein [Phycisphaerales bacterium]